MNYIFRTISYDSLDSFSPPVITAELEILPDTQKEWRDVHKVINSTSFKELSELAALFNSRPTLPNIKNVYFNNPVTVVLWDDGTKTLVRCQDGDTYSRETGLALCMAKKAMGNKSNFNDIFKKWIPEEKTESKKETVVPRSCRTCRYFGFAYDVDPCCHCVLCRSNWAPAK